MGIYQVPLRFTPASDRVYLRDFVGSDEMAVDMPGTLGALNLLDRLIVDMPGVNGTPVSAKDIATADRDRILVVIYKKLYGDQIESSIPCVGCTSLFDIGFSLGDLITHLDSSNGSAFGKGEEKGVFKMENDVSFRLPTGEDEYLTLGLAPHEAEKVLMRRCLMDSAPDAEMAGLQQALQQVAPLVATELSATCPECSLEQTVHFDIQSFLLSSLSNERKSLTAEVHRLARAYGWSHQEIMELPRNLRRQYVALVMAELES